MQKAIFSGAGRVLLSLLFFSSGLNKLFAPIATQGYISASGVAAPLLAYLLAVAIEVGGGALLLIGYRTRFAALLLAGFTLMATVLFHSNLADQMQMIMAMKNLAIIGGLLQLAASGSSGFSLDRRMLQAA